MATETTASPYSKPVVHVVNALCTRTLNHFAEEAKLNGESLKDAFERYEIDYAWHVLGSERMVDEPVAQLEVRQKAAASEEQKASVTRILQMAAASQPPDLLMSFDNDVPESLAEFLYTA